MSTDPVLTVAATLRAFVAGAHALQTIALLDRGDGQPPVVLDHRRGGPVEMTEGELVTHLPEPAPGEAPPEIPFDLVPVSRLPALTVDAAAGEIAAPLGAVAALGAAVRDLAAILPGRSVATVLFATDDEDVPLAIAARTGEPLVLALGAEQFPMPEGWP